MSLLTELSDFFLINQRVLQANYPGLTLAILERTCHDHLLTHSLNNNLKSKLLAGAPLAYLFKQQFFYDTFFYIDENVLIPRSESELLVSELLSLIKSNMKIAEVGVGSGALSLSLLKELKVNIDLTATDISVAALNVAKVNHFRLKQCFLRDQNLKFIETDRLDGVEGPFDIIFTNPPYIKEIGDADAVHEQVKAFEPAVALFLPDNEYDLWFTDFFKDVYNKLKAGGHFLMEGHERHLQKQTELLKQSGFSSVTLLPDLSGRDRFLKGIK